MPTVLLLNPPGLPGTTANREGSAGMGALSDAPGGFLYPPHLLATAAAVLRQARLRAVGLDAQAAGLSVEQTLARLPAADVLVLPVSFATLAADRAFLNRLREVKPLLKVVALGPALRYSQVAHALNDLADLLVAGEPEMALPAAARRALAGDLRPGTAVNPYTLAPAHYLPDGYLADLDALPMPAWEVFLRGGRSYPFLSVLSSRGCPAGCRYCPYVAAQGTVFRAQSPTRTVDELAYLVERFRAPHVMFRDPVFAHQRDRVLAICTEIRRRGLAVSWECESRPEHFDETVLRALHAAGCTTVKVGLETTDPDLLVAIGRVPDRAAAADYVRCVETLVHRCRQLGLVCRVFVMAGLPGQTLASARRTAADLRRIGPQRLHVKAYQWYPGIALPRTEAADVDQQEAALRESQRTASPWQRLAARLRRGRHA